MDRINENKELGVEEYLLEYSWYFDDSKNIYNQIFGKVAEKIR